MGEPEATNMNPDPRTAEVLRALQRARGTMANAGQVSSARVAAGSLEPHPLRGVPSNGGTAAQDVPESLVSSARFLENALVSATEKLTELQRGHDRAVRELRDSVQGLKCQADILASRHAWGVRRVSAWGIILGLLVAAAVALSWRTYTVALSTHAVLEQILENQARAQATKSGRRR